MKRKIHLIYLFVFCLLLAVSLNMIINCSKSPSKPTASKEIEYSENEEMLNFSNKLVKAFKAENKDDIISTLNEESKAIYSAMLTNSEQSLIDFGNALESRKLIFSNDRYAEYEITINKMTYNIAYVYNGDSGRQSLRF